LKFLAKKGLFEVIASDSEMLGPNFLAKVEKA